MSASRTISWRRSARSTTKCVICLNGAAYVRGVSMRGDQRWYLFVCDDCGHKWQGAEHTNPPSLPMVGNEVTAVRKPDRRSKTA